MSDQINVDLISCQEAEGQSSALTNKPVRDPGKKTSQTVKLKVSFQMHSWSFMHVKRFSSSKNKNISPHTGEKSLLEDVGVMPLIL